VDRHPAKQRRSPGPCGPLERSRPLETGARQVAIRTPWLGVEAMKRWLAGAITVALMAALLWSARRQAPSSRNRGTGSEPPSRSSAVPSGTTTDRYEGAADRVRSLLESGGKGDVDAYLAAFSSPARDRIARDVASRGRDTFASDLRKAAAARKSHAQFAPEPAGGDAALITVESVYDDHNERQTYRLERNTDDWLITDVETARVRVPKVKFGTPADFQEPEGVPVNSPNGEAP
jgi:hypothetical protein